MRFQGCRTVLLMSVSFSTCATAAESATITVNPKKRGAPVSSRLYGIYFEEIKG